MASCAKQTASEPPPTNEPEENPGRQPREEATAVINAGTVQQYIRGFGAASIRGWIADLTAAQRTTAFSPTSGIGLSVLRVRVSPNSADFAAEKPTIDAAKSFGATVVASAWTAPASMKTNNNTVGGKLKTTSYADYAAHLSNFCNTVGGVSAISPINEPNITVTYESMELTASEVASFVAAQGSNCGAPIMAPETFNMDKTYMDTYLSNATASSKTTYVCGHIYGKTPYVYSPGKEVWMTEHYTNTNDANNWTDALGVAKEIHDCMNAGYSMYVWWYLRRSYGFIDESGNITKRGYVAAQWARWVRPGYNKISCTANPTTGVYTTAYKSGSKIIVVAINQNAAITYQPFSISGATVAGFNRYRTTSASNLTSDSFTISGGAFGINLPAASVTTLVSY
ncbi:xylanase [Paraflavitalea soli]|uniref:Xylanase n=2 Tax=Paraflavitalea soli TaxID=2315862 RepID=A0A3B7MI84_9BACT|nr:xylanase [Paraflavitalea soli]